MTLFRFDTQNECCTPKYHSVNLGFGSEVVRGGGVFSEREVVNIIEISRKKNIGKLKLTPPPPRGGKKNKNKHASKYFGVL